MERRTLGQQGMEVSALGMPTKREEMIMSTSDIALTAPNQSVEARKGVSYACRRFRAPSPVVRPLVFVSGRGEERAA